MSRTTRLANHIERTVDGPMWHGPALLELLSGVPLETARARPLPGGHTIWELVLHITAWSDIARLRLKGEALGDPTPEQDWPPVLDPGSDMPPGSDNARDAGSAWHAAINRLAESHRQLAADTRLLTEAQLAEMVQGLDYRVENLLHGIIEHGTYHGGQIALLKKS
jgi:uncharacterized damage-inducible protein DinB